jgi:uncharacterized membrane protein
MSILVALHLLGAVIWVGGMFFAYLCLRPGMAALAAADRCALWSSVLGRFFLFVWLAVVALVASGYAMVFGVFGGMANVGLHVHLMQGLGWLMIALFAHVYAAPFRKLSAAVAAKDWPAAGAQVGRIRPVVAINLCLGLVVVVIASSGRWW